MLGTTQYMAPEQVSGRSRECTPASDVWSLGVIFYQLLADRQPFEGQTAQAIFEAILDVDPAPPCPDDLGWICLHALSKDPSARYPSGVELADDLRRWQAGTSISARPHSTLRRWRKTFVRRRGLIVAATLLGAILTLVGLISRQRSKRPADPIPGPIAEPAKMDTAAEEHQARLHKLMQPVARRIEEVRAQFYIREIDIRQELLSLEKSLVALEKQAGEEPRVWRMLGIGWYLIGWVERAEQALAKAPKDPTARYYLGRIAIDRARISLAGGPRYWTDLSRARLRQALTLLTSRTVDSTPIERLVSQAYVALAREQAKEVARICRDGLERFGTQLGTEEFWLLLTWIGTVEERLNACRAGLARCPHHPWLTLMLGIIHQTQRDYSSAMKAFDRVLQIAPRMSFAHTNRGQVHWLTGNLPAADKDFSTALALDSRDAITLTNRGTVRYEMKRNDAALADLDAALALDPGIAIAMCNRSEIRLRRGQLKGALRDADQAIRLAPRLGQAYNNRANIRKRMGNLRGAIEDYGKALEIDPSSAIRWVNRAETRAQTGDLQGALHDYGQALQRNPADGPAYYNRANLKYQLGDHTGALADYALAIKHEPGYPDAWNNRATLRRQLKDLKGALADYDQAIRLRPDDAGYYRNRGMARGESKDFRGALDDFDKALSLTPDDLALRYNRGRTYSLMGQPTAAAREYRAVLASRPKFAPCWLYLGRALLRSGQRKEALTVLNKGRAVASPELHPAFDALIVPLRKKSVTAPR